MKFDVEPEPWQAGLPDEAAWREATKRLQKNDSSLARHLLVLGKPPTDEDAMQELALYIERLSPWFKVIDLIKRRPSLFLKTRLGKHKAKNRERRKGKVRAYFLVCKAVARAAGRKNPAETAIEWTANKFRKSTHWVTSLLFGPHAT